jgi:cytochrome c-type biogenesis protein CcmH
MRCARFGLMLCLAMAGWMAFAAPALAVRPDEMLSDPVLEQRARNISRDLRCLVCQNESIDDSEADLAHDLRVLVRKRLVAGDSDKQVVAYIVARYGDFVLLKPPLKTATLALWFGPLVLLVVAGLGTLVLFLRRRGREAALRPAPLTEAERRRLSELLREETGR